MLFLFFWCILHSLDQFVIIFKTLNEIKKVIFLFNKGMDIYNCIYDNMINIYSHKKNGKRSKNVDFSIATTYIHKFINKGLCMLKCSLIG